MAEGDIGDSRNGSQLPLGPDEEVFGPVEFVTVQLRRDGEGHDVLGVQAQVHPADIPEALDEKPADTSRAMERAIWAVTKTGPETGGRSSPGRLTGVRLQDGNQIRPGAVESRIDAEENTGADGESPAKRITGRLN